ncbi:DUF397 domain-containing protein [Haloactinomyces albus]|uniref:DUF397 domain-containing protein n=1 Tax=Haloactinomyces albus TaxID=1352928 RepID=A0AAE4CLZ8_9ACTN|nr:DUF397 domain-containing protein [Haloactinomyces albus]MDR7301871.1 hypothetical protein [Haloactinomyces albus]
MSSDITNWRTSTRSQGQGTCVEVGFAVEAVGVRDTEDREGGQLTLSPARWQSFLTTLKRGAYDR